MLANLGNEEEMSDMQNDPSSPLSGDHENDVVMDDSGFIFIILLHVLMNQNTPSQEYI